MNDELDGVLLPVKGNTLIPEHHWLPQQNKTIGQGI